MKKKAALVVSAAVAAVLLAATGNAGATQPEGGDASASPVFGAGLALPTATLAPQVALPGWTFRGSSGGMEPDGEGWRAFKMRTSGSDDAPVLDGRARFAPADGPDGAPGAVRAQWRIIPSADADVLETMVSANVAGVAGGSAILDGKSVPVALDGAKPHLFRGTVTDFSILNAAGDSIFRCVFDRPTRILLQDGAYWGSAHLTLRLFFAEGPVKGGVEYAIDATFAVPAAGALALGAGGAVSIKAGPDWIPIAEEPWIEPGSALDFTQVLPHHAPAGKFGRVVSAGDHFEFENLPGVPQRFYGVNICGDANMPTTREACDRFAIQLSRVGYNALRIHHHERNLVSKTANRPEDDAGFDDTMPDPERLALFDNLVAACVEHGIYLTTDLFVSRSHLTKWRDLGIDRDGCISNTGQFKVLCAFWEPAYSNLCAWSRNFMLHVNPNTGRSLAQEPALACLALINEGNLGNWGGRFLADLPGVQEAWRDWLAAKAATGDPAFAGIPDTIPDQLTSDGGDSLDSRHSAAFAIFLAERETALFERLKAFVRDELGCKAPLSSLSCWYNPAQYQVTRTHFDYVDDHFYVDHPHFLDRNWSLPSSCGNQNPVAGAGGGAREVEWRRLMDKPFCLTEWNYSGPGRFRGVGGIATGALGALQNWSGMWRFAWSHGRAGVERPETKTLTYFDMSGDPLGLAAERAALCLFLRRDLEPLEEAKPAVLDKAALGDPAGGASKFPDGGYPLGLGWTARVGTAFAGEATPPAPADAGHAGRVITGTSDGTFILDTPRTAGGFKEAGAVEAGPIHFALRDAPATVWASSLDGKPITESSRILVTHLTDVQNNGIQYGDPGLTILLRWGGLPHIMRRGEAEISIALEAGTWRVCRLAPSGRRLGDMPCAYDPSAGRLSFTARTDYDPATATFLYEVVRE